MNKNLLTIDNYGMPHKISVSEILNAPDFKAQLFRIMSIEALDPTSEFINIIRQAMNTIADEEIERVLK